MDQCSVAPLGYVSPSGGKEMVLPNMSAQVRTPDTCSNNPLVLPQTLAASSAPSLASVPYNSQNELQIVYPVSIPSAITSSSET